MNPRVHVKGVTIDPEHSKDLDDAIWAEEEPDCFRVLVSIADVAREVLTGSEADEQAKKMVATKYFGTGNSPMLPRHLSEAKLSLWPDEAKNTITVEIDFAKDFSTYQTKIYRSLLWSRRRYTYDEIPGVLGTTTAMGSMMVLLSRIAHALLEKRRDAGALVLYDLNTGWVTTEEGFLRQIEQKDATIGYIIVQEMMIAANVALATFAVEHDVPILFRNHVARLATPDRNELVRQLNEAMSTPVENITAMQKRTAMLFGRADYGASLKGHFGLNVPAYTHFTSPIRRYADLVTHRQIRALLRDEPLPYTIEDVAAFALHINETLQAERDATSDAFKERDEKRARRAIDTRRMDGLIMKEFERVVKVEARAGDAPSEGFLEAISKRLPDGRVSILCFTVIFGEGPQIPEWAPVYQTLVDHLVGHPEDALSILAQGQNVVGWPEPVFLSRDEGPDHAKTFYVTAKLALEPELQSPPIWGKSLKEAKQKAAVWLLAAMSRVQLDVGTPPEVKPAEPVKSAPKPTMSGKDPVSALHEWCQARSQSMPDYSFEASGPSHLPTIVCTCTLNGISRTGTASKKQDAKKLAAKAVGEAIKC
jgi:ribonuclease R